MGTNISKQGIASASGNIGANLLLHTDTSVYDIGYMSSYSSGTCDTDWTMRFGDPSSIKINPSSSSTASGAYNYYNSAVNLTSGKTYCYSCWIYSDVADTWTYDSLGHFQTYTSSAAHNRTIIFSGVSVPANKWTWAYQVFKPTANCVFRSFHIYFANTSQTIWVANVKLEEGTYPTQWMPNSADSNYGGAIHGFNEIPIPSISKGNYFTANQFYEL